MYNIIKLDFYSSSIYMELSTTDFIICLDISKCKSLFKYQFLDKDRNPIKNLTNKHVNLLEKFILENGLSFKVKQ